jgi:hypothetical protein
VQQQQRFSMDNNVFHMDTLVAPANMLVLQELPADVENGRVSTA